MSRLWLGVRCGPCGFEIWYVAHLCMCHRVCAADAREWYVRRVALGPWGLGMGSMPARRLPRDCSNAYISENEIILCLCFVYSYSYARGTRERELQPLPYPDIQTRCRRFYYILSLLNTLIYINIILYIYKYNNIILILILIWYRYRAMFKSKRTSTCPWTGVERWNYAAELTRKRPMSSADSI